MASQCLQLLKTQVQLALLYLILASNTLDHMVQQGHGQSTGNKMAQTILMLLIGQLYKKLGVNHMQLYRNNCSRFTQPLSFLLLSNVMTQFFRLAHSSWQFLIFWFENLQDWNKCSLRVAKIWVDGVRKMTTFADLQYCLCWFRCVGLNKPKPSWSNIQMVSRHAYVIKRVI